METDKTELPKTPEAKVKTTSADVLNLYNKLDNLGVKIWIDGGWGVDALLAEQSRPHNDLDFALNQKDVPELLRFLGMEGYEEIRRDNEYNIVFANDAGQEIDYHAFITDDEGKIVGGIAYPEESLTGTGIIDGQSVRCISPEYMVKFHSGYELRDKDFHDVAALCEKFSIDLPEEYSGFVTKV